MSYSFTTKDYSKQYLKGMEAQIEAAMNEIGMRAERYAKQSLTDSYAVDTGLLRNSVTYAIAGKGANTVSYSADSGGKHGSYIGSMPKEWTGSSVYVGTNVHYAPYIEMGTGTGNAASGGTTWRKTKFHGGHGMAARPFIKPAMADHIDEYKQVIAKHLK